MAIGQSRLHKLLDNGKRLSDLQAWYDTFSPDVQRHILDWIRDDQLRNQGVNADNEIIGVYSEFTEALNPEKVAGTPYTLFDTGEFYRSMYIVVLKDAIVFEADPIKGDDNLFEKYGNNIIGLTQENKQKLKQLVKNNYIAYVKRVLFRGI